MNEPGAMARSEELYKLSDLVHDRKELIDECKVDPVVAVLKVRVASVMTKIWASIPRKLQATIFVTVGYDILQLDESQWHIAATLSMLEQSTDRTTMSLAALHVVDKTDDEAEPYEHSEQVQHTLTHTFRQQMAETATLEGYVKSMEMVSTEFKLRGVPKDKLFAKHSTVRTLTRQNAVDLVAMLIFADVLENSGEILMIGSIAKRAGLLLSNENMMSVRLRSLTR